MSAAPPNDKHKDPKQPKPVVRAPARPRSAGRVEPAGIGAQAQRTGETPEIRRAHDVRQASEAIRHPVLLNAPRMGALQRTLGNRAASAHLATMVKPALQRASAAFAGLAPEAQQDTLSHDEAVIERKPVGAPPPPPDGGPGRPIQTKLLVGAANDPLEREADRMASHVMGHGSAMNSDQAAAQVQRTPDFPSVGLEGGELDAGLESRIQRSKGAGAHLPDGVRAKMEHGFDADFGAVRVHTNAESGAINRAISARAFTHGSDIFFGAGNYQPGSTHGQTLLAHELTHVLQQGAAAKRSIQRVPQQKPAMPGVNAALPPDLEANALPEFKPMVTQTWQNPVLAESIFSHRRNRKLRDFLRIGLDVQLTRRKNDAAAAPAGDPKKAQWQSFVDDAQAMYTRDKPALIARLGALNTLVDAAKQATAKAKIAMDTAKAASAKIATAKGSGPTLEKRKAELALDEAEGAFAELALAQEDRTRDVDELKTFGSVNESEIKKGAADGSRHPNIVRYYSWRTTRYGRDTTDFSDAASLPEAKLIEQIKARFAAEPARYPQNIQDAVINLSGMYYDSAHGTFASPRKLLTLLQQRSAAQGVGAMNRGQVDAAGKAAYARLDAAAQKKNPGLVAVDAAFAGIKFDKKMPQADQDAKRAEAREIYARMLKLEEKQPGLAQGTGKTGTPPDPALAEAYNKEVAALAAIDKALPGALLAASEKQRKALIEYRSRLPERLNDPQVLGVLQQMHKEGRFPDWVWSEIQRLTPLKLDIGADEAASTGLTQANDVAYWKRASNRKRLQLALDDPGVAQNVAEWNALLKAWNDDSTKWRYNYIDNPFPIFVNLVCDQVSDVLLRARDKALTPPGAPRGNAYWYRDQGGELAKANYTSSLKRAATESDFQPGAALFFINFKGSRPEDFEQVRYDDGLEYRAENNEKLVLGDSGFSQHGNWRYALETQMVKGKDGPKPVRIVVRRSIGADGTLMVSEGEYTRTQKPLNDALGRPIRIGKANEILGLDNKPLALADAAAAPNAPPKHAYLGAGGALVDAKGEKINVAAHPELLLPDGKKPLFAPAVLASVSTEWLKWMHQTTIVEVADTSQGRYILTLDTGDIGYKERAPVKNYIDAWNVFVGMVAPTPKPPPAPAETPAKPEGAPAAAPATDSSR